MLPTMPLAVATSGKSCGKVVLIADRAERAITNLAEDLDILASRASNLCVHPGHPPEIELYFYAEAFVSRSISA